MTHMDPPLQADLAFVQYGLAEIFGSQTVTLIDPTLEKTPTFCSIKRTLSKDTGQAACAGLCIRAGRAAFQYWLRQNGAALGWQESEFRLLPLRSRIRRVITDLLAWLDKHAIINGSINETPTTWQINAANLAGNDGVMDCDFFCGFLQEAVCWADSGKFHAVRETTCQTEAGGRCVFEITKQAAC